MCTLSIGVGDPLESRLIHNHKTEWFVEHEFTTKFKFDSSLNNVGKVEEIF